MFSREGEVGFSVRKLSVSIGVDPMTVLHHFGSKEELLRRIADDTGGRFYESSNTSTLADDLRYTGRGVTTVEEHELWHMPIVLFLLVGLLSAEWGYRRVVGLA